MAATKVFAFGVEDAAFIEPGATPVYTDIAGVQEASFSCEVEKTEVMGDDDLLTVWMHSPKAKITLKHAVLDLDVFEAITGNTVSSDQGPPAADEILIGTDTELNPPEFALRLQIKAKKTDDGTPMLVELYIYRIVGSVKLEGIKTGESVTVTIEGDCFRSATDEFGNTLDEPARAKIRVVGQEEEGQGGEG